jgi:hypothetical protein
MHMCALFHNANQQELFPHIPQCEGEYNSPKIVKFIILLLLHLVLEIKICQILKRP